MLTPMLPKLKMHFATGATRHYKFRLQMLEILEKAIREHTEALCETLRQDLRKPKAESLVAEIAFCLEEIAHTKKQLKSWMQPKSVPTSLTLWPASSQIHYEPRGVILIIAPWNYPFQLAVSPLIGAIAAGNCALIKPSEMTPHTSQLLKQIINKIFPAEYIEVVLGGVAETTVLLEEKWDYLFFTGSTTVGKIMMSAAAKNLTPLTLELGGKSPCIVCEDADLDLAARRIVWGRYYNAGQTCVAPDYVYAHESIEKKLIEKIIAHIQLQFGQNAQLSDSYARIINHKNLERLARLIDKSKLAYGGRWDNTDLYLEPTVLQSVTWQDPVMQEEIFGPILPVLNYKNLDEVWSAIQQHEKPLAAYLFSKSIEYENDFLTQISFGGGAFNDTLVHLANMDLPFGGVGPSGMGSYHGHSSFLTFSHSKSIMRRYGFFDFNLRYPPYTEGKLKWLRRLLKI